MKEEGEEGDGKRDAGEEEAKGEEVVVVTLGRTEGREWETAHSEAAKTAAEQSPGTLPTAERGRLR